MKKTTIATFLFEKEDVVKLREAGLRFDKKMIPIGHTKVPCFIFYNVDENAVFDKLEEANLSKICLAEAGETLSRTFVSRAWSVIFTQINKVNKLPNDASKVAAICGLLATSFSMANLDTNLANRILQLIRNL